MFEAVILAGGFGTRLKSLSGDLPKVMMPFRDEPFLYFIMRNLESQGCKRIVLSLHYQAGLIEKRIAEDQPVGCEVIFVVEPEPLGTGGALKLACRKVRGDRFVAVNGDTFSTLQYKDLIEFGYSCDLAMAGIMVADVSRYGAIKLDQSMAVLEFGEKNCSGPGLINAGVYIIKTRDLLSYQKERFSLETEFLKDYNGDLRVLVSQSNFVDIGIPSDYIFACEKYT